MNPTTPHAQMKSSSPSTITNNSPALVESGMEQETELESTRSVDGYELVCHEPVKHPSGKSKDSGNPRDSIGQEAGGRAEGDSESGPVSPLGAGTATERSGSSGSATDSTSWSEIDHFWKYRVGL